MEKPIVEHVDAKLPDIVVDAVDRVTDAAKYLGASVPAVVITDDNGNTFVVMDLEEYEAWHGDVE